jgi:hypothetical protein
MCKQQRRMPMRSTAQYFLQWQSKSGRPAVSQQAHREVSQRDASAQRQDYIEGVAQRFVRPEARW